MNNFMAIMSGPSNCGKSTQAKRLAHAFGLEYISTDQIRKKANLNTESFSGNPLERFVIYNEAVSIAEAFLMQGRGVVLDGTFFLKILREGAYHVAYKTKSSIYVIEVICKNYGIIQARYEKRKQNNTMFDEWSRIEGYNIKYSEFEEIKRETLPDKRPVPHIRYDSEFCRAEILFSDGSETISKIVEVLDGQVIDD